MTLIFSVGCMYGSFEDLRLLTVKQRQDAQQFFWPAQGFHLHYLSSDIFMGYHNLLT
jgi:hypothetical protein